MYHVNSPYTIVFYVLGYATVSLWLLHYPVHRFCINFIEKKNSNYQTSLVDNIPG